MKTLTTAISTAFLLFSCQSNTVDSLSPGRYRAELKVQNDQVLPFVFQVNSAQSVTFKNGDEEIITTEVSYVNDSVKIQLPVFEGYIKARMTKNRLTGYFITEEKDRRQAFEAKISDAPRFSLKEGATVDVSGIWEVKFTNPDGLTYPAMGIFEQDGGLVKGTFRTNTGDYRFLEGAVSGSVLELSVFDSAHAFLFQASIQEGRMIGVFYSGNHYKETFIAHRNDNFTLDDPESLTFLKEGYDDFEFSFPDVNGEMVSLADDRFKNKVVVVQLMGTWCPNCLDESKFLTSFYESYQSKGLEIVALSFEYVKTKAKAFANLERLKNNLNITYPLLLAQYGSTDKNLAQEKLPMLNKVWSYPTTIVLGRDHQVRKIHTGYNGPATGQVYLDFVDDFTTFIETLLAEN
jgi:peroxiredoxin